jgi:two-component system NtrC family sensor kinase
MKSPVFSIRIEIIFSLAFLLIIALVFLAMLFLAFWQGVALELEMDRAQAVTSLFQKNFNHYLEENRQKTQALGFSLLAQGFIDVQRTNPRKARISILNPQLKQVAGNAEFEPYAAKNSRIKRSLRFKKLDLDVRGRRLWFLLDKDARIITVAPISSQGHVVGAAYFEFPLSDLRDTFLSFLRIVVFFIVLDCLVISIFGIIMLSKNVVRPIKDLVAATDKLAGGSFDVALHMDKKNELGELAISFTEMAARLGRNRDEIASRIKELEELNRKLRQAQDEVIRTEKLASVGRLAAGLAHEIGNPLGSILGYIDVMQQGKATAQQQTEFLGRIEEEIQRIDLILRNLLDYSRPAPVKKEAVEINSVLGPTLEMISSQEKSGGVRIETRFAPETLMVQADKNQLKQVFINIILNSFDALGGSGELSVSTRLVRGNEPLGEGLRARIAFTDSGSGIPRDKIPLIFDPFYSSKKTGKGTGLGLAISLRIVESFGGTIEVISEPGKGSTFTVILPAAGAKEQA